jgi:hypothetical protein
MVSCATRANIARIRRITPLQRTLHIAHGFMPNYICWTSHGGKGVIMEKNEEVECEDNFPDHAGFSAFDDDTAMKEAPEGEAADDDPTDDLG